MQFVMTNCIRIASVILSQHQYGYSINVYLGNFSNKNLFN